MAILNRKQILEADDIAVETVHIPEWGGDVLVRGLTGYERDQLERAVIELKGKRAIIRDNIRAKMVSMSVVDEDGNLVFSESDIEALGKKSASALQRIFEVAQRLSGLTDIDVEELEKN